MLVRHDAVNPARAMKEHALYAADLEDRSSTPVEPASSRRPDRW